MFDSDRRLTLLLPDTKTTAGAGGATWYLHELPALCPVNAYLEVRHALIKEGPLFRGIDAGHNVRDERLHTGSITGILRCALTRTGLEGDSYSSHSLRRGLATCWYAAGGTLETLMHHVKWKSPTTAIGYQDEMRFLSHELLGKWQNDVASSAPEVITIAHVLAGSATRADHEN